MMTEEERRNLRSAPGRTDRERRGRTCHLRRKTATRYPDCPGRAARWHLVPAYGGRLQKSSCSTLLSLSGCRDCFPSAIMGSVIG
jgi:hypothetical protein